MLNNVSTCTLNILKYLYQIIMKIIIVISKNDSIGGITIEMARVLHDGKIQKATLKY